MKINLRRNNSQIFYIGDRVKITKLKNIKISKEGIIIPNDWEKTLTHSDKFKISFENGFVGWFLPDEMEKINN